jgi:hypothetical protein
MSRIAADGITAVARSSELDAVDRDLLSLLAVFSDTFDGAAEAQAVLGEIRQMNEPQSRRQFQVRPGGSTTDSAETRA